MSSDSLIYLSQSGLEWVGREGSIKVDHPYLFVSRKGQDPFISTMQKLHELNDFCVVLFDGIRHKVGDAPSFEEEAALIQSKDEEENLIHKFMYGYNADLSDVSVCETNRGT